MAKYTIDLDRFSIRLLNGDAKDLPHDMRSTIMNIVTAVACGDLMVVQCTEQDKDIPVFLLCAFINGSKYNQTAGDRLIPLCELMHPQDLLECLRPPTGVPANAFIVPLDDEGDSTVMPDEDHSSQTKH